MITSKIEVSPESHAERTWYILYSRLIAFMDETEFYENEYNNSSKSGKNNLLRDHIRGTGGDTEFCSIT